MLQIVFLPGGHGIVFDGPGNKKLASVLNEAYASGMIRPSCQNSTCSETHMCAHNTLLALQAMVTLVLHNLLKRMLSNVSKPTRYAMHTFEACHAHKTYKLETYTLVTCFWGWLPGKFAPEPTTLALGDISGAIQHVE